MLLTEIVKNVILLHESFSPSKPKTLDQMVFPCGSYFEAKVTSLNLGENKKTKTKITCFSLWAAVQKFYSFTLSFYPFTYNGKIKNKQVAWHIIVVNAFLFFEWLKELIVVLSKLGQLEK